MKVCHYACYEAFFVFAALSLVTVTMSAQSPTDGREAKFQDSLLDKLAGNWPVVRKFGDGQPPRTPAGSARCSIINSSSCTTLTSPRRRNMKPWPSSASITKPLRYVLYWLDVFGGRASEILGYGTLDEAANTIYFTFNNPDSQFMNALRL